MSTSRVVLTYRDYAALPDDGRHYQILDGELFVTASPVPRHQRVAGNLYVLLRSHVDTSGLGEVFISPVTVILADTTVVEPDIVYLAPDRAGLVSRRAIEGAPTLLVEILSPSTRAVDRGVKLQLYARYGVPHYWIVDPDACWIEAHTLAQGAYQVTARADRVQAVPLPPFTGLTLPSDRVWPPP